MVTIPLETVDSVTITTLMDNVSDMLLQSQGPAKRASMSDPNAPKVPVRFFESGEASESLKAEHGFSALVSVTKGERTHRILFDTGVSPDGMVENMRRLSLSPKDIEVVVLSHGHPDHTIGLNGLVDALGGSVKMPVTIHPEFWSRRRLAIPGSEPRELPSTSKSALIGAGFEVIEERQPSFLLDGSFLVTGEVDRTTEFEKGFPVHQAFRSGEWQPDPLILDDQALVMNVHDKGIVVLTGCGHAGIVNIVRYARKLTGIDQVYAVIGGYHLNGPSFEPIISDTCKALLALAPEIIVPAHCTGWRAVHALAAAFPDAFIQNSVGTRLEL
jgi:7,8-dihydropterin-6-yl-methyl-4-(beta-D-ribofuranosyl)aminobenzene 5'-phosphate synthase